MTNALRFRSATWSLAAALVLWAGHSRPAAAKPTAPITVEFAVPAQMQTGDEVTTVLGFRALADVEQLEVSVAPFRGVEVTSEPRTATFRDVRKGAAPTLEVRVRLTDPKWGLLAVTYRTQNATGNAAGSTSIVFGDPK